MPRPKLNYLTHEITRHGKRVWYVRMSRQHKRIRIHGEYGSAEFMAAYHAAIAGQARPAPSAAPTRGTFAWLVTQWQASTDWARAKPATRRQRQNIIARMIAENRNAPFAVTSAMIEKGHARRAATPFAADNWLKVMKALYRWAHQQRHMDQDPAAGVKLLNRKTTGHKPWTPETIAAYETQWGPGTKERLWLHVLLYTGLRIGDAYRLGRQHLRDGRIAMTTEKTGARASFPLLPQLAAGLAAAPHGGLAFITAENGQPFQTKEGFANAFRKACRKAGIIGFSPHGLRKALATQMAAAGVSELELQAWFTWADNRTSSVYTRTADRERLAQSAASKLAQHKAATSIPAPEVKVRESRKNTKQ